MGLVYTKSTTAQEKQLFISVNLSKGKSTAKANKLIKMVSSTKANGSKTEETVMVNLFSVKVNFIKALSSKDSRVEQELSTSKMVISIKANILKTNSVEKGNTIGPMEQFMKESSNMVVETVEESGNQQAIPAIYMKENMSMI